MTRVAVVGGGITGLAVAYRLRQALGPDGELILIEGSDRLGGKTRTAELAGCAFDMGAEAFLARRPEVPRLAGELGLGDAIVHPAPMSARIRAGGRTHALPTGTVMGVPASVDSVREVLSEAGADAVRAESSLPPLRLDADVSVGALLRERVGDEVVDRLVEPLLGGVYAGSADTLGLRATIPALADAVDAGAGSVLSAAADALPPPPPPGSARPPVFGAFLGGYARLVDRLVSASAAQVRLGSPVRALAATGEGWRLEIGSAAGPETLEVDAVALAVPAPSARRLLRDVAPAAARGFEPIEVASMAVVGLAFPRGTELPASSGVLIARNETHADGTPFIAKAFTFSGRKWPHLVGAGGEVLVRGSVGRFGSGDELRCDDAELLRGVCADLAELTGVTARPVDSAVVRWGGGLPQYGVGHADVVAEIERAVATVPGLAVAGAALHGVGVPACLGTAEEAATRITGYLDARRTPSSGSMATWRA
jgi:oxygen-dependent protoporphyrinogen oxidase